MTNMDQKDLQYPYNSEIFTPIAPTAPANIINGTIKKKEEICCYRKCSQRINKIYYIHRSAGLNDRHYLIYQLAQIAGYLCAQLELPPPSILLSPDHNNDEMVHESLDWEDFRNLTFQDGNVPVVVRSRNSSFSSDFENWKTIPIYDMRKYADWLHVVTDRDDKWLKDYAQLEEYSWMQDSNTENGFIWEIHRGYYNSDLYIQDLPKPSVNIEKLPSYSSRMRPHHDYLAAKKLMKRCVYTNDDFDDMEPFHMKLLRKEIWRIIQKRALQNSIYGFFHLRRGDAIEECSTDLQEIQRFLLCSLNGTEVTGKNITLLLGSDERDETYRKSILQIASDNYSHVRILDSDKITKYVLRRAINDGVMDDKYDNNFYIYELQKFLSEHRNFSSFVLQKRRSDCLHCARVVKRFPSAFQVL